MSEQARLQELEDIQAITRLKARYVHAADGGWTDKPPHDAEGVASLFVPDGVWDGGRFGRGEGHDGIRAYFQGAIETTPMVFHHTSSPDIQVDGDTATGSWHVVVPMIQAGVSSVLVMGGCGDYFDAADTVIRMCDYRPEDATSEAREVAARLPTARRNEQAAPLPAVVPRIPQAESFDPSRGRREVKIDARALDKIQFGREDIDLRGVEQLLDRSQTRAIGNAIHLMTRRWIDGTTTLSEGLDALEALLDAEGLDVLDPFHRHDHAGEHPGNLARPRRFEIAAAINRLRTVRMHQRRN